MIQMEHYDSYVSVFFNSYMSNAIGNINLLEMFLVSPNLTSDHW